jgi:hypothetical protein
MIRDIRKNRNHPIGARPFNARDMRQRGVVRRSVSAFRAGAAVPSW